MTKRSDLASFPKNFWIYVRSVCFNINSSNRHDISHGNLLLCTADEYLVHYAPAIYGVAPTMSTSINGRVIAGVMMEETSQFSLFSESLSAYMENKLYAPPSLLHLYS
jgi:hypothetical protein